MKYFIIATTKNGDLESEITHYGYNNDGSNRYTIISKTSFSNQVYRNTDTFICYNIKNNTRVDCKWIPHDKTDEWYLRSDPNSKKEDNLVNLPDCLKRNI
ncbi:DUF3892 domain-containing protein [Candidatus Dojkabacteria bacterium]|nr:DUF3892 domain-containing protein [Candidatus Dojkabacteria bacterium]